MTVELNTEQSAAVLAPLYRPVMVVAGPGSGKTRTLTARVAHVIESGANPASVIVTTFTRKSADEMRTRLLPLLGPSALESLRLGTIHANCFRILKEEGRGRRPIDSWEQKKIIDEVLGYRGLNWDVGWKFPLYWIGWAKRALVRPDGSEPWFREKLADSGSEVIYARSLAHVYHRYEQDKQALGCLDFDDMLMWVRLSLRDDPAFLARWQRKVEYVLLDEAQDTSVLSMDILAQLAAPENRIFAVGDPRQLLYRWSGAAPEDNVWGFPDRFPGALVLPLSTNYRSTQEIISRTNLLARAQYPDEEAIPELRRPFLATLRPRDGADPGPGITVSGYGDDVEEANAVGDELADMVKRPESPRSPHDFFIIYRTNAQSRPFEDALMRHGLPYVVQGSLGFYERAHVKDVLCYLRLVLDEKDAEAFERVANIASAKHDRGTRGFGKVWLSTLRERAQKSGVSLWQAMEALRPSFPFWQQKGVADLERTVSEIRARSLIDPASEREDIVEPGPASTGPQEAQYDAQIAAIAVRTLIYDSYLERTEGVDEGSGEGAGKLEDLDEFVRAAGHYKSLGAFLAHVRKMQELAARGQKGLADAVVLTTVHRAKGLERPVVFGAGLSEGLLPHAKALISDARRAGVERGQRAAANGKRAPLPTNPDVEGHGVEDERCVAFVLVSRAQEECHLSWIERRAGMPEDALELGPSRFLGEMGLLAEMCPVCVAESGEAGNAGEDEEEDEV